MAAALAINAHKLYAWNYRLKLIRCVVEIMVRRTPQRSELALCHPLVYADMNARLGWPGC
tara:strand:+ start:832 stop:1011 length:180 start_codon:yes stop_codon:yes gene_type:complete